MISVFVYTLRHITVMCLLIVMNLQLTITQLSTSLSSVFLLCFSLFWFFGPQLNCVVSLSLLVSVLFADLSAKT